MDAIEFDANNILGVDHGVEGVFPSAMINDHAEFFRQRFWDHVHGRAGHASKEVCAKRCR